MNAREILGEQVRKRREQLNLSQQDAAAKAGVLRKTLSNLETGAGDPTIGSVLACAGALGCEVIIRRRPRPA